MGTKVKKSFLKIVCQYQAAIVLMHIRGNPRNMQKKIFYQNVLKEVTRELNISLEKCLEAGIKKDRIIIDPGLGFAKTTEHNLEILSNLYQFHALGYPVLIGPSRKFFIGQVTGKEVGQRLMGTAAAVSLAAVMGANIVRAHDVAAMKDVLLMSDAVISAKGGSQLFS